MDQLEYIEVLWRVIYALGAVIAALIGTVWQHILKDRKTAIDVQRLKDKVGINGA
mgnify:CR=1 FL=1